MPWVAAAEQSLVTACAGVAPVPALRSNVASSDIARTRFMFSTSLPTSLVQRNEDRDERLERPGRQRRTPSDDLEGHRPVVDALALEVCGELSRIERDRS